MKKLILLLLIGLQAKAQFLVNSFWYAPPIVSGAVLILNTKDPLSYGGSGTTWSDVSGSGNHFTIGSNTNIPYDNSGFFNFNSTPSSQSTANAIGSATVPVQRSGSFSVNIVIRRNSTTHPFGNSEQLFTNTGNADGFRIGFTSSGQLYYLIGGGGGAGWQDGSLGGSGIGDSQFHLLTIVFDRAAELGSYKVYGYKDGVATGNATITAGASGNTQFQSTGAYIGYNYCCAVLRGHLAYVSAYNKALTQSEVTQNYSSLKPIFGIP
jgi:hypothetical protein